MSWNQADVITPGKYIMAEIGSGVNFDLLSTITPADVAQAVAGNAAGWTVMNATWERGVFGIAETLRIYGRATSEVASQTIRAQVETGVNGFWAMMGAEATIYVSDNLTMPESKQSEWVDALRMVAIAAVILGIVWGIKQVKDIVK